MSDQLTTNDDNKNFEGYKKQQKFITKVFMLLGAQMFWYMIVAYSAHSLPGLIEFQKSYDWIVFLFVLISICLLFSVAYFPNTVRQVPTNYIFYGVFTLCWSYLVSFTIHYYEPQFIFTTLVLQTAVVVSLMVYSMVSTKSFTMWGGLFYTLAAVLIFGLALGLYFKEGFIGLIGLVFGTVLFGLYLVYDMLNMVQNIDGRYCIDDYVLATLSLYIDIVGIFLSVLKIISNKG